MELIEDKIVRSIIDELKKTIRRSKKLNWNIPKFIFVCGEQLLDSKGNLISKELLQKNNNIRYQIIENLGKYSAPGDFTSPKNKIMCVISESLYKPDAAIDILTFEKLLAEISEEIIIVTESPGSFCELGAFALDDDFAKNIIVVNQDNPSFKNSFITRGPIKKIQNINENHVILYSTKDHFQKTAQFITAMKKIGNKEIEMRPNNVFDNIQLKYLIYEFANIIELFQPIEKYEVGKIYNYIKDFTKYSIQNSAHHKIDTYNKLLGLMEDMKLIEHTSNNYYTLNTSVTCFDALFNIERQEFNEYRNKYLSRVYKWEPERIMA